MLRVVEPHARERVRVVAKDDDVRAHPFAFVGRVHGRVQVPRREARTQRVHVCFRVAEQRRVPKNVVVELQKPVEIDVRRQDATHDVHEHQLGGADGGVCVHAFVEFVPRHKELRDVVHHVVRVAEDSIDDARAAQKPLRVDRARHARVPAIADEVVELVHVDAVGVIGDHLVPKGRQAPRHGVYELARVVDDALG